MIVPMKLIDTVKFFQYDITSRAYIRLLVGPTCCRRRETLATAVEQSWSCRTRRRAMKHMNALSIGNRNVLIIWKVAWLSKFLYSVLQFFLVLHYDVITSPTHRADVATSSGCYVGPTCCRRQEILWEFNSKLQMSTRVDRVRGGPWYARLCIVGYKHQRYSGERHSPSPDPSPVGKANPLSSRDMNNTAWLLRDIMFWPPRRKRTFGQ